MNYCWLKRNKNRMWRDLGKDWERVRKPQRTTVSWYDEKVRKGEWGYISVLLTAQVRRKQVVTTTFFCGAFFFLVTILSVLLFQLMTFLPASLRQWGEEEFSNHTTSCSLVSEDLLHKSNTTQEMLEAGKVVDSNHIGNSERNSFLNSVISGNRQQTGY